MYCFTYLLFCVATIPTKRGKVREALGEDGVGEANGEEGGEEDGQADRGGEETLGEDEGAVEEVLFLYLIFEFLYR